MREGKYVYICIRLVEGEVEMKRVFCCCICAHFFGFLGCKLVK